MADREHVIALGTLAALKAAELTPNDPEILKAYALALPDPRAIKKPCDNHRASTFLAIQTLRKAIDGSLSEDRVVSLHSAALAAACRWVEARSEPK